MRKLNHPGAQRHDVLCY